MDNLTDIKGLGPATKEKLNNASIYSIEDLLLSFPKSYKIQKLESIHQVKIKETVSLEVEVVNKPSVFFFRKNLTKLSVKVNIQEQVFKVDIFNRHFLSKILIPKTNIVITGQFKENFRVFTASDIVLRKNFEEGIIPQYQFQDIKDGRIRKVIELLLEMNYTIDESLPDFLIKKRHISNINDIIRYIHKPLNNPQLEKALYRLKYQELIEFALRIELIKSNQKVSKLLKKTYNIEKVRDFITHIGFELTNGQKQATNDIFLDLKSEQQMNRLLQGDVGSGKTIFAVLAALAAVTAGQQVAVMAPTLVLAHQHYSVFKQYLSDYQINIVLLTSEISLKEKGNILEGIRKNDVNIVIGTHALIQEQIEFMQLGLAIIDEQHRFGVEQRKKLRIKGYYPDILLMSATPIPRSLAISVFESSDISQITEKPLGRKPIITEIVEYSKMDKIYKLIEKELILKNQVYVICPLIEESDHSNYYSVSEIYKIFANKFKQYQTEALHGKMNDSEKVSILNRFKLGQTQILVSTTVIEVGVHIDQATTMVIMNANAFGLAQLHQLRGRIGRSDLQSYCCLVVDEGIEDLDRLKILEQTDDGFMISEYDLKLRGPGEVFGKNQAGIPNFNFANIVEDEELLKIALEDAKEILIKTDNASKSLKDKVIQTIESYHLD